MKDEAGSTSIGIQHHSLNIIIFVGLKDRLKVPDVWEARVIFLGALSACDIQLLYGTLQKSAFARPDVSHRNVGSFSPSLPRPQFRTFTFSQLYLSGGPELQHTQKLTMNQKTCLHRESVDGK
ncbi:uncharacterized protein MYCFIDRAFT_175567 [Pseudocercospora fijiensis CIRAD86]|uniref:Uncharacterized protein n=1 Tax=Pseudocercospora fijiensis (strain CIRAD86) TaxID=383855 RepID=M3AX09_PSEFD|nr:uncharacterized protein MYCFIDRAFT_175567 [Pseudocercospora fijiensis CIRAD86]EME82007.1 hypothetical protein MYCFIDRAFT_175567 [Pseudocercospora fijiensis CIRAD86]